MNPILKDRLPDLDGLVLAKGSHASFESGACVMEAAAWLAGEGFSDHPACVSPVLGTFLRRWNDDLETEGRQMLKPFIPKVLDTAGDGQDEARGWLAADWLIREYTPTWLELAGVTESAAALRGLAPIRDLATVESARPTIGMARKEGEAAWAAAWAAAGAAADKKLTPTREGLQASALILLERMIDPSAVK